MRLIGGLGNQLFQIQYANYLNKKKDLIVYFDDSFFAVKKKEHEFLSSRAFLNFPVKRINIFQLKFIRCLDRIVFKLGYSHLFTHKYQFIFNSDFKIKKMTTYIFDGFWQDKIFLDRTFVNHIRAVFKKKYHYKLKKNPYTVCVHIRRGDYLTNRHFFIKNQTVLDGFYYQKAMSHFDNKYTFYVYSDDLIWTNNHFRGYPNVVVVNKIFKNPVTLLCRMSEYRNFIIANSTLSWWAAVISSSRNKKVFMPLFWNKNQKSNQYQLPSWEQI